VTGFFDAGINTAPPAESTGFGESLGRRGILQVRCLRES
jgi:hypothetical protein